MNWSRCIVTLLAASLPLTAGCIADADDAADVADEESENIDTAEEGVTTNAWNFVCAETLTLRNQPGGAVIGTMYNTAYHPNSWFYPVSFSNGWAYGFSYSLNRWGWAMNYYLTTNYSVKGIPDQAGWSWWCHQNNGAIVIGGGAS